MEDLSSQGRTIGPLKGLPDPEMAQNTKSDGETRANGDALQAQEQNNRAIKRGGGEIEPARRQRELEEDMRLHADCSTA